MDEGRTSEEPSAILEPITKSRCRPNTSQAVKITILRQDVLVKRKRSGPAPKQRRPPRPSIREFSPAAIRRFKQTARNGQVLHTALHLTYPAKFPTEGRAAKRNLAKMLRWLARQGLSGLWVLEFQERGAPHFHILLTGRVDKEKAKAQWYKIVGSGDAKHLIGGARIEDIRHQNGMIAYAVKSSRSSSKSTQKHIPANFTNCGRFWGRFGGFRVDPVCVLEGNAHELAPFTRTGCKAVNVKRRAAGYRPIKDRGRASICLYGASPVLLKLMRHR